jgi:hypothetical protein
VCCNVYKVAVADFERLPLADAKRRRSSGLGGSNMDRREFLASCGTALATTTLDGADASGANGGPLRPKKAKMHLGCQRGPTTAEMLDYGYIKGVLEAVEAVT